MEINHLLKDVISLNEYITATQDVMNKFKNLKVSINIATVLTLKKIRSLEIEYLNKCDENGVACIVFERLLTTPPSKVWGVLAKELIYLLQYWLEAIRKHLIDHSTPWWMFLKLLLKFIKEIRLKDPAIPNMLVELTAECLFDLATAPRPDVFQRHEILHTLNMVCAESGREIRFAMRPKFGDYFVKIAAEMATSGYLPCQYSSLECLLRWLVPRQERALRAAAADRWLPRDLCPPPARAIFLNTNWMNFFQDARDFLNALNAGNGLVTSVICRRLCIGEIVIINGSERQQSWLDFNTTGKSISVLLDPRVLEVFGVTDHRACETFFIDNEMTDTAVLHRESLGLTITLSTTRAPYIRPTDISTGEGRRVTIVLSSRADLRTLDEAMRTTFGDKYQLLLNLDTDVSQSPLRSYNRNKNELNSEEDTRFSHPVEIKRRKHSGYIVRSKIAGALSSPSTASTSSLIQLKDRLAALPRFKFDKEPVSVCAQPALSHVSELTEQDDRSIYTTKTDKKPYGVGLKSFKPRYDPETTSEKSRSDGETVKNKFRGGRRLLSPVVSDDNSTSLLLVATVGSTNDTVINDTIERLSKSKDYQDDNIVDLLVQEALQGKPKSREVSDSGINTDEKKSQEESEAIEDTPNETKHSKSRLKLKKHCTIVSKSTTDDESNTEAINEAPAFVNTGKNVSSDEPNVTAGDAEKQTFHAKTIEEFFSQHIAENKRGEIVISPTLAKKINETSSETSENFDENYLLLNEDVNTDIEQAIFNDIAIIDCLNDMVDKVCSEFVKCTEYFYNENDITVNNQIDKEEETEHFKDKCLKTPKQITPKTQRPKRNIKLKYKPVKKTKARASKKTKNIEQESPKKMSIIIEQKEEDTFLEEINQENDNKNEDIVKATETPCNKGIETPVVRRKRKLYSPKDEHIEEEIHDVNNEKTSDDVPLSKVKTRNNTITTATCYKEIENDRKKYTRLRRSRKSKVAEMPSPRTVKNNSIFDNLKQTVESNEKITLVDKNKDVFNFTDSDDDDFKKKMELKKRTSTTTVSSFEAPTTKRKRNTRRAKESESSHEEAHKTKPVKRKKVTKRTQKRNKEVKDAVVDLVGAKIDLVDERMRETITEKLNTSMIIENTGNLEPENIQPVLKELPQMEEIDDSATNDTVVSRKNTKKTPLERIYDSECNNALATKKRVNIEIGSLQDSISNDTTESRKTYKRSKKTDVEEVHDEKSKDTLASKKKATRSMNKTTELLKIKKEKGLMKKGKTVLVSDKDDDGTISPLPGLLVESMPKHKEDINDSLMTNMLQKFKRIYQDGPDAVNDSVNTQNMLSDIDKLNNSAQNWTSVTDDIFFTDKNKQNTAAKSEKDKRNSQQLKQVEQKIKYHSRQKIINNTDDENSEIIYIPDLIDVNDNQPDKSISTEGITAHGDFEEEPPNPETIGEELYPRELHDLDQSMKDYFTKITREIHNTSKDRESSKSVDGDEACTILRNEADKTDSAVSPIIAVKRLSFEDISRWMPSRRTSDTDSPFTSPKVSNQAKQEYISNTRNQTKPNSVKTTPKSPVLTMKRQESSSPESIDLKSSFVPIAKISLEEFDKWLPMPKNFVTNENVTLLQKEFKTTYGTRSKCILNKIIETDALFSKTKDKSEGKKTGKEITKPKRAEHDTHVDIDSKTRQLRNKPLEHKLTNVSNSDSDDGANSKDVLAKKTAKKRNEILEKRENLDEPNKPNKVSNFKNTKNLKTQRTKSVTDSTETLIKNKSIEKVKPTISPIKLVDKFAPDIGNTSLDEDECLEKIRSMFSNTRENRRYNLRNTTPKSKSTSTDEVTPVKKTPQKRKSTSSIQSESKKRLFDPKADDTKIFKEPKNRFNKKVDIIEDVVISGSGQSLSSVTDWFKKAGPIGIRDNDASMSYKATIENVMEKLDTTLIEINENTSKKFVNLIMEAQKSLHEQKEERLKLYKQVATVLISDIIKIVDEKFTELDKTSQAMGDDFMEKLKKQAFDVIRNDCKQKRAMVVLLKEDVQAVIDHIERSRRVDSP